MTSSQPAPDLPRELGGYRVLRRLAQGGMGEVLLAESVGAEGFAKRVVIKRILESLGADRDFVSMFRDEARITSQLHHGNIAQVIHFGVEQGQHFLVLEYVDGPSLRCVLDGAARERRDFPIVEAVYIMVETAKALDYAHRKTSPEGRSLEIVHRDVSPSNVLLSREGQVKLTDFGIARARARFTPGPAGETLLKGKIGYMAPETVRSSKTVAASDLFALGAVAYEMATGVPPFWSGNEAAILHKVLNVDPPRPSVLRASIPAELDDVIMQLLDKDPSLRPSRAMDVVEHLTPLLHSELPIEALAKTIQAFCPPEAGPPDASAPRLRTVLVIDESRTVRMLLRSVLGGRFRVDEATSIREAMSGILADTPVAVLCQRILPDGDALALHDELRARGADMPFFLFASDLDEDLLREAERTGITGVIPKSSPREEILETLIAAVES